MADACGNKTTERDVWCEHCGWVWPWHSCEVVEMTPVDEAACLIALEQHDAHGHPVTEWGWSGCQFLTLPSGWQVVVFSDCGEWDYLEWVTAPDGRQWHYPHRPDNGQAMTERLAGWQPSHPERWVTNPDDVLIE